MLGALVAGIDAGRGFPTWPDMNGQIIPNVLIDGGNWKWENLTNYDSYLFAPAFIQFTHRMLAYLLVVITIYMFIKLKKKNISVFSKRWLDTTLFLVFLQVVLGVLTVLNVEGKIPLFLGTSHQLVGVLFLMSLLFLNYSLTKQKA